MDKPLIISRTLARHLAVTAQYLAGPCPNCDAEGAMEVINQLGCLQLDPINVVARSHLLVLWSRIGNYNPALLDTLPMLEQLAVIREPRTTLLSPFDNLICNRKRTQLLFDFSYQSEIYSPKDKRRFGYYVMPILHGNRLIGRIDPALNRAQNTLVINAIHIEPNVPITSEIGHAVSNAIQELAHFLNAISINYCQQVPQEWKHLLS